MVLGVWWYVVEEDPVLQATAKYGEGVVCILGVPVIDGQAYGGCPSCQHTGNSVSSGLGRLGDELLWHWI